MTKMRSPNQPASSNRPRQKFSFVAVLISVLIVAAIIVLIVQSGVMETLNLAGILR